MYLCIAESLTKGPKGPNIKGLFLLALIAAVLYELAAHLHRAFKKGNAPLGDSAAVCDGPSFFIASKKRCYE